MWTDSVFNLILLSIASVDATAFYFILAVSNCGYIIFNFLNLNAGWIHRIDSGHIARPYRAPTFLLALGGIFAFVNAMFMGAGAKVWNPVGALGGPRSLPPSSSRCSASGTMSRTRQVPAHDAGRSRPEGWRPAVQKKAGILPYLVLVAGLAVVLISNWVFTI